MAEAIVSVVLEQLATVVGRHIQHEVKLVVGADDEVRNLTSNFQTIQAVLADAEQRQVTDAAVGVWLEKLKDVSYDMDDVLDKWNTVILRSLQPEGAENAHSTKRKVRSCILFPYSGLKHVVLSHDIASKIKAINDNLDRIVKEKEGYNFKLATSVKELRRMKSTSFVDVSKVFGVDEQTKALVSQLLCESSERKNSFHIISIVGMGGMGKTTLAQLAYNNNEVMRNFEKRIWVCVSKPFDELRIAKAINEALGGDNSKLVELESVLQEIHKSILEKKILLVLDDVWTEDPKEWEPFHNCLRNCLHGSKVLVTTRNQGTADMMKSIETISIKELSNEHCWSLFSQLAFFDRSDEECEKLEGIGREIVSKCKGLPLAAKTMGSLLRFKRTRKEWENILYNEMWELKELENEIFLTLILSYYDLPSMVQRCFTCCAMFPKDFIFEKDELIKLWMAQGYLGLDQNKEIEIIGEEYFNSLAMRSFFQEFVKDDDGSILKCKMHDIVHDVAQYLVRMNVL